MNIQEYIDICRQCMIDCVSCAYEMAGKESMNDCPKCCIECADACEMCMKMMIRGSKWANDYARICSEVCEWCASQCGQHGHDHCKKCAESCRRCADMLSKVHLN